jgi:hypothetical protein
MGDHSNERVDSYIEHLLFGMPCLELDDHTVPWILNHIDCFDRQARLNKIVKTVRFYGYSGDCQDNEVWEKVGQAIGNLQRLFRFDICTTNDDDEVLPISYWEILARILSQVRQKIKVDVSDINIDYWDAEQFRLLAQAIRGHPTITTFEYGQGSPYEHLDILFSALATLPALESIGIYRYQSEITPDDESALAQHESLTKLLRTPSLRSVCFDQFDFTSALCQATANALMEGTAITSLAFIHCSFSVEGCATMMAHALSINRSVSSIGVVSSLDQTLFDALATALPSNSTLQCLDLRWQESSDSAHLSPVLLALCENTGVKTVLLDGFGSMDESLCTAMKDGLGMNATLESLGLNRVRVTDDNSDFWCRALSFLRTNMALISLVVSLDRSVTESCVATFCTDIGAMLKENASLESLRIRRYGEFKVEEYVELITALQHNMKLKSLFLSNQYSRRHFTDEEDKQIAVLLQKNYALEIINLEEDMAGDVSAILRLNQAGRRYLVQDGSAISKGVDVLSRVNYQVNCVFLHLLENPRLCDRSAVETESETTDNTQQGRRGSTSHANHNGKRDHEQNQELEEGKESRIQQT